MGIKNQTWLTINFKEDTFDVKLSNESNVIQDIRSVDSEINIAGMLDKKIIYAMQEIVDAEMNHKQYMQDKKFIKESIMQYKELRQINVNQHIEKKNGLSYLSWSWAVDQLLQLDDGATWEYLEPKQFGESMMVFCKVTAFGKSRTAQLPVMDFRNQAIPNPNAYQVNTAMQRCLAKAISLHGIGLYIYAGEDLPLVDQDVMTDHPLKLIAQEVTNQIKLGNTKSAHERCENLSQEDKLGVWSLLNAKTKLALKKYLEA